MLSKCVKDKKKKTQQESNYCVMNSGSNMTPRQNLVAEFFFPFVCGRVTSLRHKLISPLSLQHSSTQKTSVLLFAVEVKSHGFSLPFTVLAFSIPGPFRFPTIIYSSFSSTLFLSLKELLLDYCIFVSGSFFICNCYSPRAPFPPYFPSASVPNNHPVFAHYERVFIEFSLPSLWLEKSLFFNFIYFLFFCSYSIVLIGCFLLPFIDFVLQFILLVHILSSHKILTTIPSV